MTAQPLQNQASPSLERRSELARRVLWARLFDEHASALLALAVLITEDSELAETITGLVLSRRVPLTDAASPSATTRRSLVLAVVSECRCLVPDSLRSGQERQARIAVGLALYAGLSDLEIAAELEVSRTHAQLLRRGVVTGAS